MDCDPTAGVFLSHLRRRNPVATAAATAVASASCAGGFGRQTAEVGLGACAWRMQSNAFTAGAVCAYEKQRGQSLGFDRSPAYWQLAGAGYRPHLLSPLPFNPPERSTFEGTLLLVDGRRGTHTVSSEAVTNRAPSVRVERKTR